jgi:hypothetical protein
MGSWLQECPHCRYVAPDLSEAAGDMVRVLSPEYVAALNDSRLPELARRFAAYSQLILGTDQAGSGYAMLRAAWVCDDHRQKRPAIECRNIAADRMATQRPFPDTEQGVTSGAVLVDVLRRAERFEEAAAECDSLLGFEATKELLRSVLEYQARLIAARDTACRTVSDALK